MRYYSQPKEVAIVPKAYEFDWEILIKDQAASGMNMKQYCQEKGIPYHAFKNHKYALQKEQGFIPLNQQSSHDICLVLNGNQISISSKIDDQTLARVLKAISQ